MRLIGIALVAGMLASPAAADEPPFEDALLDRLTGEWVLQGMIAGEQWTHDITAEWVLGHQYVQIHEVSRETDDAGAPQYEARVFIGWDKPSGRYVCLWLDSTGGGGLANDVFGYAGRAEDKLAFVFGDDAGRIHNTFAYHRGNDRWTWAIDNEQQGVREPFARVTLTRKP